MRSRLIVLSHLFGFTPNEVWQMQHGEFVGYAAFVDDWLVKAKAAKAAAKRTRR